MKSKHTNKKAGLGMLRCQECGQECTQVEFHHGLNLCDHLALDAVALTFKKNREQRQGPEAISAIDEVQKVEAPHCPRCRGLMVNEQYVDWECNGNFVGWRCFSCGNVWDGVIANNRMSIDKRVGLSLPLHPARSVVLPISIRPMSGRREAPVRK